MTILRLALSPEFTRMRKKSLIRMWFSDMLDLYVVLATIVHSLKPMHLNVHKLSRILDHTAGQTSSTGFCWGCSEAEQG